MELEQLNIIIKASTDPLKKGLNDVKKQIEGLEKTTSKASNNMGKGLLSFKNIVKGLGIGYIFKQIANSMGEAISRLDTLNNYTKVMSNLGVSSEDAELALKVLEKQITGLPTKLDDAAQAVQRLTAKNGNVKASTAMFVGLNNALLAGGTSANEVAGAMEQVVQAYSKGKPDMMEWRRMAQAMPGQLKQIGQAMGYASMDDLGEALRSGKVSMNEFMATITKLNKEGIPGFQSFEKQAKNSALGVGTSITNLKTAISRGLANIMNAIGQTNIAGFFNRITDAINKVMKYVAAFVKVVMVAVSFIAKLFGKDVSTGVKEVSSGVGGASSSMGDLADNSNSAGKGMDKASGSAKKLKKELAGLAAFDEMNVLKEPDNSDSGSGGSGGSGDVGGAGVDLSGVDLSMFDEFKDKSDEADKIFERLKSAFAWFVEDMDFNPLVNSIKNLGEALKYLKSGVVGWVKEFVTSFLKPLATWTINEALPRFLNATANAIKGIDFNKLISSFGNYWKALEPFAENVGNGLLWFYEKVLLPIGKWVVNDVVPAYLDILTGALKIVNKAIDDVKPMFSDFFNKVLEPLAKWTGGVISDILKAIGDALNWIGQNEVAVTILEALAIAIGGVVAGLALLNAIDAVVTAIKTAQIPILLANAAAWIAVEWPILAVIAALTIIIAIILAVAKNWDKIKDKALEVWNKVKETWQVVADWFSDIFSQAWEGIKAVVQPWIDYFKAIWESIKLIFAVVKDVLSGNWSDAWEKIKAIVGVWKDFFKGIWDGIKNVFSSIGNWFKDKFQDAWNKIKAVFSGVGTFFGNIWNTIKAKFTNIGQKIGSAMSGAFKGAINGLLGMAEKVLNFPINAINTAIKLLNKVPGVNISRLATFSLPRLAQGAVIDKPTIAMIGEAGREAVIPLENNTGWIDNLASMLVERADLSGEPSQITIKIGEETIFNKVIDKANKKAFERNGGVFEV